MKIETEKLEKEAPKLGIEMVILFGSQASGKAREDSDYDVAVLTTEEKNIKRNMDNYNEALMFLCSVLDIPDSKIDLTNLNNANPLLAHEILFQGKILYGKRDDLDELRARAFRYFIDAKPLFSFEKKMAQKKHETINQTLKTQTV